MRILNLLHQADCGVLQWTFIQRDRRLVTPAARILSRTGDGYMPALTIIVCFSLSNPVYRQIAWQLTLLFLIERIIYFVAKNTLRRQRPAETLNSFTALVVASDKFSFPSGHTSAATLYAAIIYQHFPIIGALLLIWAAGVGSSRVVLGVHYPSDILAGASLGLAIASVQLSVLT
ncbi:phosphatase PAP2 family protein [Granulosicoccus antarcticus]|uniref:undecaprenyl-diphosphate phosphatase n=1 Tax=Granulosicoccus antarcticus IMCC3135 TaxID=1192854 RepID=A0A2Z2NL68_9GAMM|nr:phosphatase PAP2 family protein [Granulosicoccus antarcticus]ASJ70538.1 Phosphatidylglycerophosphatase B [Granulosicoccus antarcticus IMCC3135]